MDHFSRHTWHYLTARRCANGAVVGKTRTWKITPPSENVAVCRLFCNTARLALSSRAEPARACTTLSSTPRCWRCRPWWRSSPTTSATRGTPWRAPRRFATGRKSLAYASGNVNVKSADAFASFRVSLRLLILVKGEMLTKQTKKKCC